MPSGASTGAKEALELRDKDPKRFDGKGVKNAIDNINKIIKKEIIGLSVEDQRFIDNRLIDIDGTENKKHLGANAILGVSLDCAFKSKRGKIPLFADFKSEKNINIIYQFH